MSQSRNTDFPGYQKKERFGTNNDNINATYETTDTQAKKNCTEQPPWNVQETYWERDVMGWRGGRGRCGGEVKRALTSFIRAKPHP